MHIHYVLENPAKCTKWKVMWTTTTVLCNKFNTWRGSNTFIRPFYQISLKYIYRSDMYNTRGLQCERLRSSSKCFGIIANFIQINCHLRSVRYTKICPADGRPRIMDVKNFYPFALARWSRVLYFSKISKNPKTIGRACVPSR